MTRAMLGFLSAIISLYLVEWFCPNLKENTWEFVLIWIVVSFSLHFLYGESNQDIEDWEELQNNLK